MAYNMKADRILRALISTMTKKSCAWRVTIFQVYECHIDSEWNRMEY